MTSRCLLILMLAVFLGACGDRATPEATFDRPSNPQAGFTSADDSSPLPTGVVIDIPNQLRSDVFYINTQKAIRRRVVVQFLEGDVSAAVFSLTKSMQAAGFRHVDSRKVGARDAHARFQKTGYGMVCLLLKGLPNSTEETPVRGTITFDLPPPSYNDPAPAKERASGSRC